MSADVVTSTCLQYVFVLTKPMLWLRGGHLWLSSNYGKADSFEDVTERLPGQPYFKLVMHFLFNFGLRPEVPA